MGRFINGKWSTENSLTSDEKTGEFNREPLRFRHWISSDENTEFPAEAGRYHLYVSRACPWAHRTTIMRRWKGMEDAISLSIVEPVRINDGWEFSEDYPDYLYDSQYLRELYVKADPHTTCGVTVPVLWHKKQETIVNNESWEIIRMLDTEFDDLAKKPHSFCPPEKQKRVDKTIDAMYELINNGVYRAGFA